MFPRVPSYSALAKTYDVVLAGERGPHAEAMVRTAAEAHCRRVCDFACGTGTLLHRLQREGLDVAGCDLAGPMIDVARALTGILEPGRLAVADMRTYRPPVPVELATCNFDSINYLLTAADWQAFFVNVAAALAPGGTFIFDCVTPFDLRSCWPGHRSMLEAEGVLVVRTANYDPARNIGWEDITLFAWDGAEWQVCVERHEHAAFEANDICDWLQRAGFEAVTMWDGEGGGPASDETQRLAVRCIRRAA